MSKMQLTGITLLFRDSSSVYISADFIENVELNNIITNYSMSGIDSEYKVERKISDLKLILNNGANEPCKVYAESESYNLFEYLEKFQNISEIVTHVKVQGKIINETYTVAWNENLIGKNNCQYAGKYTDDSYVLKIMELGPVNHRKF